MTNKTLDENIEEGLGYVDYRIAQMQKLADERGCHITEVEDRMGNNIVGPWLKMRTDLLLAQALNKNTEALNREKRNPFARQGRSIW